MLQSTNIFAKRKLLHHASIRWARYIGEHQQGRKELEILRTWGTDEQLKGKSSFIWEEIAQSNICIDRSLGPNAWLSRECTGSCVRAETAEATVLNSCWNGGRAEQNHGPAAWQHGAHLREHRETGIAFFCLLGRDESEAGEANISQLFPWQNREVFLFDLPTEKT